MSEDYKAYGPGWVKEMMNFSKESIIKLWLKPNLIKMELVMGENKKLYEALEDIVYVDGDSLGKQYEKIMAIAEKALHNPHAYTKPKKTDRGYQLIPMNEIDPEARELAVTWVESSAKEFNDIRDKHKLASDVMNYARRQIEKLNKPKS